jgi:hypothetical protein
MFYVFMKYAKLWELTHATGPNPAFKDEVSEGGPEVTHAEKEREHASF